MTLGLLFDGTAGAVVADALGNLQPATGRAWLVASDGISLGAEVTSSCTQIDGTPFPGGVITTQPTVKGKSWFRGPDPVTGALFVAYNGGAPMLAFAMGALQPKSTPLVVTPEQFGAVGDDIADDSAAILLARDAIIANGSGTLLFGVGSAHGKGYFVGSTFRTDKAGNAIIPMPNSGSGTIVLKGFGATAGEAASYLRTNATGKTYSGTFGPPSVVGGPTPEVGSTFSSWNVVVDGLGIKVPTDSTVAGYDFVQMARASVKHTLVTSTSPASTLPTSVYSFGLRMPKSLNSGSCLVDDFGVTGLYAGLVLSSPHTDVRNLVTKWCRVGVGHSDDVIADAHASRIGMWQSEHCVYHLAGWNVTAGLQSNGATKTTRLIIDVWDIEDAAAGPWYVTTAHLLDANNTLSGRANFNRTVEGVGPSSADLTVTGGGRFGLDMMGATAAWQTYTPVLSGTGWALGAGTVSGQFARSNRKITAKGTIVFGAGATFGGSPLDISLPVAAASGNQDAQAGEAQLFDTSASVEFSGTVKVVSSTVMRTRGRSSSGGIIINANTASTVPFPWAAGDVIRFEITYEPAA